MLLYNVLMMSCGLSAYIEIIHAIVFRLVMLFPALVLSLNKLGLLKHPYNHLKYILWNTHFICLHKNNHGHPSLSPYT